MPKKDNKVFLSDEELKYFQHELKENNKILNNPDKYDEKDLKIAQLNKDYLESKIIENIEKGREKEKIKLPKKKFDPWTKADLYDKEPITELVDKRTDEFNKQEYPFTKEFGRSTTSRTSPWTIFNTPQKGIYDIRRDESKFKNNQEMIKKYLDPKIFEYLKESKNSYQDGGIEPTQTTGSMLPSELLPEEEAPTSEYEKLLEQLELQPVAEPTIPERTIEDFGVPGPAGLEGLTLEKEPTIERIPELATEEIGVPGPAGPSELTPDQERQKRLETLLQDTQDLKEPLPQLLGKESEVSKEPIEQIIQETGAPKEVLEGLVDRPESDTIPLQEKKQLIKKEEKDVEKDLKEAKKPIKKSIVKQVKKDVDEELESAKKRDILLGLLDSFNRALSHYNAANPNAMLQAIKTERIEPNEVAKLLATRKSKADIQRQKMMEQMRLEQIQLQREQSALRRKDYQLAEKRRLTGQEMKFNDKIYGVVKDFEKDDVMKELKKQDIAFDQVDSILKAVERGNELGISAMGTKMARAMGEVGVLTDKDVVRYIQRVSISGKVQDALTRGFQGDLTDMTKKDLKQISDIMRIGYTNRRDKMFNKYSERAYQNFGKHMGLSREEVRTRFAENTGLIKRSKKSDKKLSKAPYGEVVIRKGKQYRWNSSKGKYVPDKGAE